MDLKLFYLAVFIIQSFPSDQLLLSPLQYVASDEQSDKNFIYSVSQSERGYSSVVEHSTADREVPGSNPGVPLLLFRIDKLLLFGPSISSSFVYLFFNILFNFHFYYNFVCFLHTYIGEMKIAILIYRFI